MQNEIMVPTVQGEVTSYRMLHASARVHRWGTPQGVGGRDALVAAGG